METDTTIDETTCTACMTIPVSHLALEAEAPLSGSWQALFDELGIRVVTDTAGRKAIPTPAARKLFAHLRHRAERAVEDRDRLASSVAAKHPVRAGGIRRPPEADPSMSAYEVMLSVDADKPDPNKRLSPVAEFLQENFGKPRKAVEGKSERR